MTRPLLRLESTMPHDPLILYRSIPEEIRARLAAAADDRAHPMHLCTLATVDTAGAPDARLLVVRGADGDPLRLWFHVDARSRKIDQVRSRAAAVVIAYDPGDGVLLRLRGMIEVHVRDAEATRHWEQLDVMLRHGFRQSLPPGEPIPHADPRIQRALREHDDGFENFAVLELRVTEVEWFQTTPDGDRRAIVDVDGDWSVEPRTP